jgi:hypothetical protein
MRAAIEKQGERLRVEAAERESANEGKDAVNLHIKVVKHRPAHLVLDAKVHGRDFFGGLKSKARQLTFAFPSRKGKEIGKLAVDRPKPVIRSGPMTLVKAPTAKQSHIKLQSPSGAPAVPMQMTGPHEQEQNSFAGSASSVHDEREDTALLTNSR